MPIYTRKDFLKTFGVTSQYLSMNVKRGKIIMQGNYISSDVYENSIWIEEWKIKNDLNAIEQKKEVVVKEVEVVVETPKKNKIVKDKPIDLPPVSRKNINKMDIPPMTEGIVDVDNLTRNEMDMQMRRINLLKAQEDLELARIKKEKQLGLVIPTELVLNVFARHFASVTNSFYQAADNLLIEIIPDRTKLSEYRSRLVDVVNNAVDSSREDSKKEIQSLVDEYAESRNVGERK